MTNEGTNKQWREIFDRTVEEMKNPDKREIVRKKRAQKQKKVAKKYGM